MLCPCGTANTKGRLVCTGCLTPLSLSATRTTKPAQAEKPTQPAKKAQPAKPTQAVKQVQPAKAVKPAQADRSAQGAKPTQADKPAQANNPVQGGNQVQSGKQVQGARAAQGARPGGGGGARGMVIAPTRVVGSGDRMLRLEFAHGTVTVGSGQQRRLGRLPDLCPDSGIFAAYDTVSGRHAILELRADGTAWINDDGSRNGTFVNDVRLTSHRPHPLRSGDRIRFADELNATVRLT